MPEPSNRVLTTVKSPDTLVLLPSDCQLDAGDPQAYAHMATFLLNSQRFEESLERWQETLTRVDDPQMKVRSLLVLMGGSACVPRTPFDTSSS